MCQRLLCYYCTQLHAPFSHSSTAVLSAVSWEVFDESNG
jgi:hypothetical protein